MTSTFSICPNLAYLSLRVACTPKERINFLLRDMGTSILQAIPLEILKMAVVWDLSAYIMAPFHTVRFELVDRRSETPTYFVQEVDRTPSITNWKKKENRSGQRMRIPEKNIDINWQSPANDNR
jgi:hypothetical protein